MQLGLRTEALLENGAHVAQPIHQPEIDPPPGGPEQACEEVGVVLQLAVAFQRQLQVGAARQQVGGRTLGIAALHGLDGAAYWDAAHHFAPQVQAGAVALGAEVDRVYARPAQPLELRDAAGTLRIHQDAAWPETVVWNPGPALCATLADLQGADWMRMLCVEAAAINQLVALHPGQRWQAAQTLQVVA